MLNPIEIQFLRTYTLNLGDSWNKIAEKAGMSIKRAKRIFQTLVDRDLIRNDTIFYDRILGPRIRSHATTIPHYRRLGLTEIIVEVSTSSGQKLIKNIQYFRDVPYTSDFYEFGAPNNAFMFFVRCPLEFISDFVQLLNLMVVKGEILGFTTHLVESSFCNPPEFGYKEENLRKILDDEFARAFMQDSAINHVEDKPADVDFLQLQLLREIELNGRLKVSMISHYYDKDYSTLTRRIKRISNELIKTYCLRLNTSKFQWIPSVISGRASGQAIRAISDMANHGKLPLKSKFYSHGESFTWIVHVRPKSLSILSNFLSSITEEFSVKLISKHSSPVTIYIEGWDEEGKRWRCDLIKDTIINLDSGIKQNLKNDVRNKFGTIPLFDPDQLNTFIMDMKDLIWILTEMDSDASNVAIKEQLGNRTEEWRKRMSILVDLFGDSFSEYSLRYLKYLIVSGAEDDFAQN